MRFQLILIFMNTKVTKSCGVKTKSGKNIQQKNRMSLDNRFPKQTT